MYSFKQIVDSLSKKKNSKSSLWVKTVVRRLSFPFTYLFINLGCSAWLASMISVFVAVIGTVVLCINSTACRIIGVVLIELWLVLDCVDGNIARVKKTSSEMGEFVDALSGYYVTGFVYLGIGVSACYTSKFDMFATAFIILGGVSSVAGTLARLIHQKYTYTILILEREKNSHMELPEEEVTNKHSIQYLRSRIDKEIGISGLFMPFLIVAFIFNIFDLMIVFYAAFQILGLLAVTFVYSMRAK